MRPQSVVTWLKIVSVLTALSAVPLAFASAPVLSSVAAMFVDVAFWPIDGRQTVATLEARLFSAIAGGVTIGIAAFTWMVADRVYMRDPAGARSIIVTGLTSWCIVDSLGSIAAGAPMNVVLNAVILAAFLWPLRSLPRES